MPKFLMSRGVTNIFLAVLLLSLSAMHTICYSGVNCHTGSLPVYPSSVFPSVSPGESQGLPLSDAASADPPPPTRPFRGVAPLNQSLGVSQHRPLRNCCFFIKIIHPGILRNRRHSNSPLIFYQTSAKAFTAHKCPRPEFLPFCYCASRLSTMCASVAVGPSVTVLCGHHTYCVLRPHFFYWDHPPLFFELGIFFVCVKRVCVGYFFFILSPVLPFFEHPPSPWLFLLSPFSLLFYLITPRTFQKAFAMHPIQA